MNTDLPTEKQSLLKGIKEHIDAALGAKPGTSPYCSKTTSLAVCGQKSKVYDLEKLVHNMWGAIAANWVEMGGNWSGEELCRWELTPKMDVRSKSQEIKWQRGMIDSIREGLNKKKWANEVPTSSGLGIRRAKETGGLDLAHHKPEDRCMQMIELKVTPKSQNPVSAALQISVYAMMLILVRKISKSVRKEIADPWNVGATSRAELYVLAPSSFYIEYPGLDDFQQKLSAALEVFGEKRGLPMSFGFRVCDWYNDDLKYPEEALLEALSTPMPSVIN